MKIYLAGKISGNDWRSELVGMYKQASLCFWKNLMNKHETWESCSYFSMPDDYTMMFNPPYDEHELIGPYLFNNGDEGHGCLYITHGIEQGLETHDGEIHNHSSCDCFGKEHIRKMCQEQIKNSDRVFAWITKWISPGTLWEIGYAEALGKQVDVAVSHETPDSEVEDCWLPLRLSPGEHYFPDVTTAFKFFYAPKKTYKELLKSPLWQKKRLEIFEKRNWTCENCSSGLVDDKQLHLHHQHYLESTHPWDYADDDFVVLCETCHNQHHRKSQ